MQQPLRSYITYIIVAIVLTACHATHHIADDAPVHNNRPAVSPTVNNNNSHKGVVRSTPLNKRRKQTLRNKYAGMMHVAASSIKNYKLYNVIDDWYGVSYQIGGNDMGGIDCSGWVKTLYKVVYDKEMPRTAATQYDVCHHTKKIRKLKEGDLVFFNVKGEKLSHVGVYLKNRYFVHASKSKGIMISSLDDAYWQDCFYKGGKTK